jgi:hypothetical protein
MQNRTHIKYLKALIGTEYTIHSLIVFSNRCTFKDVDFNAKDANIIHRCYVKNAVDTIDNNTSTSLTEEQINTVFEKLYPCTQVSEEVKVKHIKNIRSATGKNGLNVSNSINGEKCPRCGGTLVLRTAKQGSHAGEKFWGCNNYPRCRYIRNAEK